MITQKYTRCTVGQTFIGPEQVEAGDEDHRDVLEMRALSNRVAHKTLLFYVDLEWDFSNIFDD